jgi:hypothetical protein
VHGVVVAEGDVVELQRRRGVRRERPGVGRVRDRGGQVEHLEDALEADHGGHHVDVHVGQPGERAVETAR